MYVWLRLSKGWLCLSEFRTKVLLDLHGSCPAAPNPFGVRAWPPLPDVYEGLVCAMKNVVKAIYGVIILQSY
jgi:hypothetical protein